MAMNPNFGLPVCGKSNNSFFPPNQNYNPNISPSFPVFQQNSTPPFPPHNSHHVFQGNSHVPGHAPSFLPDLEIIKSVPPPPLMNAVPPNLSNNRIPETHAPPWNSSMNNRHFVDQARHSNASSFGPPMFPSANRNPPHFGKSGPSNGFSNQHNSLKDTPVPQTCTGFQGNHLNMFNNSNSSFQPRPNSFAFAPNRIEYQQNNGNAAFSNAGCSANHMNNTNPHSYSELKPMQVDSKQRFCAPEFKGFHNRAQNVNEHARRKSPYRMQASYRNQYDVPPNNFQNMNGNRRHNPFGLNTSRDRKFQCKDSIPHSMNSYGDQSGLGKKNIKTERNEDSKPFSCDTCDRAFASEVEMKHHLSEHIKCNSGDCQFEAHPKIVALHKKMQHDTGYADAISKLKSSDDIEKWRAERRRRFPTVENIKKRKAEEAEKEARGEVIENKDFGKFKRQNKQQNDCRNNNQGNTKKRRRCASKKNGHKITDQSDSASKVILNVSALESDSDDDSHIKLPKFPGMTAVLKTPDDSGKEDLKFISHEFPQNCKEVNDVTHHQISNSAIDVDSDGKSPIELIPTSSTNSEHPSQSSETGGVTQNQISDSVIDVDSDNESPIELPIERNASSVAQSIEIVETSNTIFNSIDANSDDPPVELPIRKSTFPINQSIETDHNIQKKASYNAPFGGGSDLEFPNKLAKKDASFTNQNIEKERKTGNENSKAKTCKEWTGNKEYALEPRRNSLLEKLLADDIRHERNAIMQCIRHVVKKNFFGIV